MPFKLQKPCGYPGCIKLIGDGRYCVEHMTQVRYPCRYPGCPLMVGYGQQYCLEHKREAERVKESLRHPVNIFYHTQRWRDLRDWYIKHHPVCALCGGIAEMVDHVMPIQRGGDALSESNLQSLCRSCHRFKTQREK